MTKKSQARLQRDTLRAEVNEFRKNDKTWDNLTSVYAECRNMLYNVPAQIQNMFSVEKIGNFLTNPSVTADLIRCLSADVAQMKKELDEIYESHKGRTGSCASEEEFIASLTCVEAYNAFQVKFSGVIMTNVNMLSQHFEEALVRVNEIVTAEQAAKAQQETLLDPTVVSDAVVKEEQA